jgi:hypothetical protein
MSTTWLAKCTLLVTTGSLPILLATTPMCAATAPSSPLSNQDIVSMVQAGLPPSVVEEEIKSSRTAFDTSVEALIALKEAGVADEILRYIVNPRAADTKACQPTYSISGSAGTVGATIAAGGHSAIAGVNGTYEIMGLPSGTYTIRPSKTGCTFSPSTIKVNVPPNALAKNFKASCSTNNNARVTWTVIDGCGGGIDVFFFDTNGATYPNGPGKPGFVDHLFPTVFSFEAARGSTLLLGAEDAASHGISWCFGIDGDQPAPPSDTNCFAKVPIIGDLVRTVRLTCP